MTAKLATLAALAALIVSLASCGQDLPPATQPVTAFYEFYNKGQAAQAAALFSPEFRRFNPDSVLLPQLQYDLKTLGQAKPALDSWTERQQTGGGEEGTYYLLNYTTQYGETARQETFIVRQPKNSQQYIIMNRNLN